MTTRRDFLKGFGALLGVAAIVRAPASALATIKRLGTPQQWIEPAQVTGRYTAVRSGRWTDPATWGMTDVIPGAGSDIVVASGTMVTVDRDTPVLGSFAIERATMRYQPGCVVRFSGRVDAHNSLFVADDIGPDRPIFEYVPQDDGWHGGNYVGNLVTSDEQLRGLGFSPADPPAPRAAYDAALAKLPPLFGS